MKHFLARGKGYVAVFSAPSEVEAARVILALFAAAGVPVEEMEVLEIDPTQTGGILLSVDGREVGRI